MDAVLAAARSFYAARLSLLSTRTLRFDGGVAYLDEDYPDRYIANLLVVESKDVSAQQLVRTADEIFRGAGLGHRRIRVADDALGARVVAGLRVEGYSDERALVMILRRPPDRPATHQVHERGFEETRALTEEIYRRELPAEPATAALFVEQHARWDRLLGTRRFVVDLDGAPVGQCELYTIGPDAQIEYVDTLEEYRGRGVARAVVLAAAEAARADGARHVFIYADSDDWPSQLYERLGFDAIGQEWEFSRPPET